MTVELRGFMPRDLMMSAQGAGARVEAFPDGRYGLTFPSDETYEEWSRQQAANLRGADVIVVSPDTARERQRRLFSF